MKLADTSNEPGFRSEDANENIWFKRKVVNTIQSLIKMNRVTFLKSIEIIEEEPAYKERNKMKNYFMMHDKDFTNEVLYEVDMILKDYKNRNLIEYQNYASQFDMDS